MIGVGDPTFGQFNLTVFVKLLFIINFEKNPEKKQQQRVSIIAGKYIRGESHQYFTHTQKNRNIT